MPGPAFVEQIVQSPIIYVDSKHLVVNQAPAEPGFRVRGAQFLCKACQQVLPHRLGNVAAVGGIDIAKEYECPENDFPMLTCQLEHSTPLQFSARRVDYMRDVRSVEALTTGDEKLRGQQLFRRQHLGLHSYHG